MSIYKYIGIHLLLISKLRLRAASLKSRRKNGTDGKEDKEEERRETGYLLPPNKYLKVACSSSRSIGGSPLEGVREDMISIVLDRR